MSAWTLERMNQFLKRAGIDPETGTTIPVVYEIGTCIWCSRVVYSNQEYESGRDGEGVMHTHVAQCEEDQQ